MFNKEEQFEQGKTIEEFKKSLEKSKEKSNELEQMVINNGSDFVYDYCQELRYELDLAIEYRKKELDEIRDSILKQIETIEKELNEHISKQI